MNDVLCLYYSRSGNTRKAAKEVAEALGAELVELRDEVDRGGWKGYLRCGLDAMSRTTAPLAPFQTERPLGDYKLVILATPVWAGRCSSIMRGFVKKHGRKIQDAAYLITRGSEAQSQEVFDQLDRYVPCGHKAAVSLRSGSVGYAFWQEEFLRQVREFLAN